MQSPSSSVHSREAGFIVGETSPLGFTFVSSRDMLPPRLEYLVVPGVEERGLDTDGAPMSRRIDVLAQVVEVGIDSTILSDRLTYEETRAILHGAYAPPPKMCGSARVVGYLAGGSVRAPRCAPSPGSAVYIASEAFLQRFFSLEITGGVIVGTLMNRPDNR